MNKILNKTELKREIRTYKKYLEDSKKYQLIFILTSVVLVALSAVSLFFIYYDYNKNWTDIYFLISIIASAIILLFLIPISLLWFYRTNNRVQVHMPIITLNRAIDICSIIVGIFNFFTAVFAALAPIYMHFYKEQENNEAAWKADQKVILYIIMAALIFLMWSILFPIAQDRLIERGNEYFNRYALFEYEKVPEYIKYLQKIYPIRAKEFNIKIKGAKTNLVDKILTTPVGREKFSYYIRRVYRGHTSKYGDEYDLIKYCVFIQIFEKINEDEIELKDMHLHLKKFMHIKDKETVRKFNNKFLSK